jgi:hypothetical protein
LEALMFKDEIKWWAGAIAAGAGAVAALGVLPDPYAKWALAVFAFCGAVAAYNITPPSKVDRR